MRKTFSQAAICFSLLLATTVAQAQKINYLVSTYFKIAPEKEGELMDIVHGSGEKLMREWVASGDITGATFSKVVFTGLPAGEYNYVQSVNYEGTPPEVNPAKLDQLYRKATGMSYQDYQQKIRGLGTVVGTLLNRVEASTPGVQTAVGMYLQVTRLKITPLHAAEYADYTKKVMLPYNTQLMKDGKGAGWLAYRRVSPVGADEAFDATTATVYKDMAGAIPSTTQSPDETQMEYAKIFPGQSFVTANDQARAVRRVVRTELWRVMARVER